MLNTVSVRVYYNFSKNWGCTSSTQENHFEIGEIFELRRNWFTIPKK
jgi:hypothetical protein